MNLILFYLLFDTVDIFMKVISEIFDCDEDCVRGWRFLKYFIREILVLFIRVDLMNQL